MKITAAICKEHIAKKSLLIIERIKDEFEPRLEHEQALQATVPKNWTQRYKEICIYGENKGQFERLFDCKPFDDQLRAYVYTDPADTYIVTMEIQGE